MSTKFPDINSEYNSIYQEIARKRALLGITIDNTRKHIKKQSFSSRIRYLVGHWGVLPYLEH